MNPATIATTLLYPYARCKVLTNPLFVARCLKPVRNRQAEWNVISQRKAKQKKDSGAEGGS